VAVCRRGDGLELRFHGSEAARTIDVPGWTLEGEDVEGVQLRLLAELGRRGYRATLER
jgi:hypothetical protein